MRYKQANNIYSTEIKNQITGAIRPGAHTGLNWSGLSSLHLMNILATVTCSRCNILTLKIILLHVSLQFFCNNFSLNSVTVEFSYSFYSSVANDFSFVLLRKLMQALQISHAKKNYRTLFCRAETRRLTRLASVGTTADDVDTSLHKAAENRARSCMSADCITCSVAAYTLGKICNDERDTENQSAETF